MEPREIEELLGAYALDAVDSDERAEVERYIAANPRAAAEVRAHREVATMLAYTGAEAPVNLWDRIAAEIDPPAPTPGPELAKVMPLQPRPRAVRSLWMPMAAAACVAAAVTFGAMYATRPSAEQPDLAALASEARAQTDATVVTLAAGEGVSGIGLLEAVVDADGHGYLLADSLPDLTVDKTYQLWGVVNEEVISLGVFGNDPATEPFSVDGPVSALALTIEVEGGVASSEQTPVYAGEVT
jgi:anti-sigma-K factor RskA